jgi:uncharacterized protein YggE
MNKAEGMGASQINTAPLSPGQMEITVTVSITYEIK